MASIRKRGEYQWQAQVRRDGHPPQTKTFATKKDAAAWSRMIERAMDQGTWKPRTEGDKTTLDAALQKYAAENTARKKGAAREANRIKAWRAHKLAKLTMAALRGADIAKYRDDRRADGVSDATIRLELMLLSSVYETARKDWGYAVTNPVRTITLPSPSRKRERRLEHDEETRLLDALDNALPSMPARTLAAVAIETGMRQGELLRLEWDDIDLRRRVVCLSDTKSGDPRDVPLSSAALKLLRTMPKPHTGPVFAIRQDRLIRAFQRACDAAEISDLTFHDLRHEAASRLASKLSAHELCKVLGWKTMQMALRYYHPRAEDLARKLG